MAPKLEQNFCVASPKWLQKKNLSTPTSEEIVDAGWFRIKNKMKKSRS